MRRKIIEVQDMRGKPPREHLTCFVCGEKAPLNEVGWESMYATHLGNRDLCPKHRMSRSRTMTTIGELIGNKIK